jgi:hypothetical protein
VEIAAVAKHFRQSPMEVETWPYPRFLRYQETMYLSQELEAQHIDSANVSNGKSTMKFGGGDKLFSNPPKIPEPKEYKNPIPNVIQKNGR